MEERIQNLKNEALAQIMGARSREEIENLRVTYLGRKGELNTITQQLKNLPQDKRGMVGRTINDVKEVLEKALWDQKEKITDKIREQEFFDPTIPAIRPKIGHLHPVTQAISEIGKIFERIGFVRVRYPEVEWDWYAFGSLNMPENHPARVDFGTPKVSFISL